MPPDATPSGPRRRGREAGPSYLSVPCIAQAHLQTLATGFSPWVPLPAPHLEHGEGGRGSAKGALSCQRGAERVAWLALSPRDWNRQQAMQVMAPALPPSSNRQGSSEGHAGLAHSLTPPLASAGLRETGEEWLLTATGSGRLQDHVLPTPSSPSPPPARRDHRLCLKMRTLRTREGT